MVDKFDTHFSTQVGKYLSGSNWEVLSMRTLEQGLRTTNQVVSDYLRMIRSKQFKLESLIMAQNERWRQA
jgi:hypothetical protein